MLQLQRDSFEKVERVFVMGLRARDSAIRQKFFALYNAAIECTLFARMRYIIVEQDWEQLAQFFWLKQALVRLGQCDAFKALLPHSQHPCCEAFVSVYLRSHHVCSRSPIANPRCKGRVGKQRRS